LPGGPRCNVDGDALSLSSVQYRRVVALVLVLGISRTAAADDAERREPSDLPGLDYLWDGGALPFLWGALAGRIALDRWATPRATPMGFSMAEGGSARPSWEVPGWAVTAAGGLLGVAMIGSGDDSRWYHLKGLAEGLATGCFVTGGLKVLVGRHRPTWDPATDLPGDRRSFPSGHSTQAFAIATYANLYLRGHVFDRHRDGSEWPAYELATYGAIYLGAAALAGERVLHDRHHLTDVVVGAALGTATSALFYWYQERRYKNHERKERDSLVVAPFVGAETAGASLSFTW
jgi:membrane-associated phospholipid phosphatase